MKAVKTLIATMVLSAGFATTTLAQEAESNIGHKREVGLRTTNFNSLDLVYAFHTKANRMVRLRAGQFNVNASNGSLNTSLSIAVGFQRYKTLDDKFSFFHGFEPSIFNTSFGNGLPEYNATQLRLGYMLGFNYNINDKLKVYAETIPALYFNNVFIEGNPNQSYRSYGFNFSSQFVSLGLHYKF